MENKLLRRIMNDFIIAGFVLVGIFSVLLFWHEDRAVAEDIDMIFEQFEAVYARAEKYIWTESVMYRRDYAGRGKAIDAMLARFPELKNTEDLQKICRDMDVDRIYLLDEEGRICLSSVPETEGKRLLKAGEADEVRKLIRSSNSREQQIGLDSPAVFTGIPAQDYVAVKSSLEEYSVIFMGVTDSIAYSLREAASIENLMESVPSTRGQTLLVIDPVSGDVLGSTWGGELAEQIEEKDLAKLKKAQNRRLMILSDSAAFVKSRMYRGMLLVSAQDFGDGMRVVDVQILGCFVMLVLTSLLLMISIRRYFKTYIFAEFEMIEDTVKDLVMGKEGVQFHTLQKTEMSKIVEALNKLTNLNEELKMAVKDSDKDSLTGLVNRSGFEKYLKAFMSSPKKKGVMIMMDIDNFKAINDNMGHPEGDRVLQIAAKCLKSVFREEDMLVRLGGDEFVVFLNSEIPLSALQQKLDEVIQSLRESVPAYYAKYQVSISVGAAVITSEISDYEKLYQCADDALYEAKKAGKNQYVIRCCKAQCQEEEDRT